MNNVKYKKEAIDGLGSPEKDNGLEPNYLQYTDPVSVIVRKALWIKSMIDFADRFFGKNKLTPDDFIRLWNYNWSEYGHMTLDEAELALQMTRHISGGTFDIDEATGRINYVVQP